MRIFERRTFQTKGTVSAKIIRWDYAWCVRKQHGDHGTRQPARRKEVLEKTRKQTNKHCRGSRLHRVVLGHCKDVNFCFEGYGNPLEVYEQRNDHDLDSRGSLCAS